MAKKLEITLELGDIIRNPTEATTTKKEGEMAQTEIKVIIFKFSRRKWWFKVLWIPISIGIMTWELETTSVSDKSKSTTIVSGLSGRELEMVKHILKDISQWEWL